MSVYVCAGTPERYWGKGDQRKQKGTDLHGHLFETFSFHPLAGAIFYRIILIILSSKHILLTYLAYLIYFVSYQCLKRILLHFKKGTFAPPTPPSERQEGACSPLPPSPACLCVCVYLHGTTFCTYMHKHMYTVFPRKNIAAFFRNPNFIMRHLLEGAALTRN